MMLTSGCQGPGADEAAQAATTFYSRLASDQTAACDLLAPRTSEHVEKESKKTCPEGLNDLSQAGPGEGLPTASSVRSVDVFGHDARVVLDNDVVFLARFADGWRITAAGCRSGQSSDAPYDCVLSGG